MCWVHIGAKDTTTFAVGTTTKQLKGKGLNFLHLEEASVTVPLLQDAAHALLAQMHQHWKTEWDLSLKTSLLGSA